MLSHIPSNHFENNQPVRRSQRLVGQKRRFGTSLENISDNYGLSSNNTHLTKGNNSNLINKNNDIDGPEKKRCRYNLRSRSNANSNQKQKNNKKNIKSKSISIKSHSYEDKENNPQNQVNQLQIQPQHQNQKRSLRRSSRLAARKSNSKQQQINNQKNKKIVHKNQSENDSETETDEDIDLIETNNNKVNHDDEDFEILEDNDDDDDEDDDEEDEDEEDEEESSEEIEIILQPSKLQYKQIQQHKNKNKNKSENEIEMKRQEEQFQPIIAAWDQTDLHDDLAVVEYANDIINHLKCKELESPCIDYMKLQNNINYRMRTILVDWLISVHRKFRLEISTLYLSINILDRYLTIINATRETLQLIGCSCMWIASKYHDIYAPEASDFVYISDNAFTIQQLIECELNIMVKLSFDISVATSFTFAQRYIKIACYKLKLNKKIKEYSIIESLVYYLIEHSMMDYKSCHKYLPSKIAAASIAFALLGTDIYSHWPKFLQQATGFTLNELSPIMKILDNARCNQKHEAVIRKYSSSSKNRVAMLNFDKLNHKKYF